MKIWMICAALAASAMIAAGCGSGDDESTGAEASAPATIAEIEVDTGPFDSDDEFIGAVDDYCAEAGVVFLRYPMYGFNADGLAAEMETLVDLETDDLANLESIEAPESLADGWTAYTDANADLVAAHEDVLAAAKAGDVDKANAILNGASTKAVEATDKAQEAVGVNCSSRDDGLRQDDPAEASDAAGSGPQPANTIEEAADEYLTAMQSGDCEQIVAAFHTQARVTEEFFADPASGDCSAQKASFAEATVAGAADFGSYGMAALEYAPGSFSYEQFVLDPDQGDELKHTGGVYANVNGLEAAPEGNDADEVISGFVDAVRENDPDALNETVTVETAPAGEGGFLQTGPFTKLGNDPEFAKSIVADIRADEAAAPALLGANQIAAAYLLETEGNDYVLVATHQPGSATEYGVSSYWALEPAA